MTTKDKLIANIIDESRIHHNISTLGMKLPDAPDGSPDDIFWNTCQEAVEAFIEFWQDTPENDSGNRNLCDCRKQHPYHLRADGTCKVHDLYHCYTSGRMGATLYWTKYWKENNNGVYFRYEESDLSDADQFEVYQLEEMLKDLLAFKAAVRGMRNSFPEHLADNYKQWQEEKEIADKREALGYNKNIGDLLDSENKTIVRHAKGIISELNKKLR